MDHPHASAIERAFQLARSGKAADMAGLKTILRREGHINGQLNNLPALSKQLRAIMEGARPKPAGQQQRAADQLSERRTRSRDTVLTFDGRVTDGRD